MPEYSIRIAGSAEVKFARYLLPVKKLSGMPELAFRSEFASSAEVKFASDLLPVTTKPITIHLGPNTTAGTAAPVRVAAAANAAVVATVAILNGSIGVQPARVRPRWQLVARLRGRLLSLR